MTKKKNSYTSILGLMSGLTIAFLLSQHFLLLYISLAIGFVSILWPKAGRYIAEGLEYFLRYLGLVLSRSLLFLIYWLVLTPIALLYRLSGKHKNKRAENSNWIASDTKYNAAELKKAW